MDLQTILGTVGVFILLMAFFLQMINRLDANSITYAMLNITGALLSAWSSYLIEFVPFIVLELTWALVSLGSLVKALGSREMVVA